VLSSFLREFPEISRRVRIPSRIVVDEEIFDLLKSRNIAFALRTPTTICKPKEDYRRLLLSPPPPREYAEADVEKLVGIRSRPKTQTERLLRLFQSTRTPGNRPEARQAGIELLA